MKKFLTKTLALVAMLMLSVSAMAIDWSGISYVGDGAGGGKYSNKYKFYTETEGVSIVNIQHPGFATADGFYITLPSADFNKIEGNGAELSFDIQGAGICLHLSNFTAEQTQVVVKKNNDKRWIFYIYFEDGGVSLICKQLLLKDDSRAARFTWETLDNGNVTITVTEPDGSASAATHFRGNGVNISKMKVGDVAASTYFNSSVNASSNVQTLTLIDPNVKPANGAVFTYPFETVEYAVAGDGNAWPSLAFNYTYGGVCTELTAPENVAVANDGTITFDAVQGATKYMAYIFVGAVEKYSQEVISGAKLGYEVYVATTTTVKVVAMDNYGSISDFSEGVEWTPVVSPLPASIWCETAGVATTKNNWGDAHFSINTLPNGNVEVAISSPDGSAANFRGGADKKGMNGTFKLNNSATDFATYFTVVKAADNKTVVLTLIDSNNKPAIGSVIDYSGQIECATSQNIDDWSNYDIKGYIYGTTCSDVAVTGVTLNQTTASIPMNKTLTLIATVEPVKATDKSVSWTSSVTDVATVANGVVTPVSEGETTITVTTTDGGFTATCVVTVTATQMTEPNVAAPTPTHTIVKAVYSDAYAVTPNWGYLEGWGQSTQREDKEIAGDNYLYYTNFNYVGWGCGGQIDVTAMEKLHIDIWAVDNGKIGIVPIYGGPGKATDDSHRKIVDLVGQQWNSFDLDLATDFAGLNFSSIFQFKFDQSQGGNVFAIDNVYFWKTPATYTVNFTSEGWATFCAAEKTAVPEDVVSYKATIIGETLSLTSIEGAIPAGTGVVLKGASSASVELVETAEVAGDYEGTVMVGTTEATAAPANAYCLSKSNNDFRPVTVGLSIPANRAYFVYPGTSAPARIAFATEVVTGIENNAEAVKVAKMLINGQLYIVRDGKLYDTTGRLAE